MNFNHLTLNYIWFVCNRYFYLLSYSDLFHLVSVKHITHFIFRQRNQWIKVSCFFHEDNIENCKTRILPNDRSKIQTWVHREADPHARVIKQGCILTLDGPPGTCIIYSRSSVSHTHDGAQLFVLCLKQCQLDNIHHGPAGDIWRFGRQTDKSSVTAKK